MKKLCIVTTVSSSIDNWIKPFLNEYKNHGVDVTVVCNMTEEYRESLISEFPFVHACSMPFPRGMSLLGSVKSIVMLRRFLKKEKFDMIQYSTPNASLYASVAARMSRIPVRLYCQWGMVYVSRKGITRKIFELMERTICRLSTHVQPDSVGNLEFCRKNGLYGEEKSCVIWNGSAKGIDLTAYDVSKKEDYALEIKKKYDITEGPVIGFVGRLGKEKGCNELFSAFRRIKSDFPKCKLLFVGPIEKEETIEPELLKYFYECDDIIKTGRVTGVEKYMSVMDVFALPSYREGFGMSVVEAAAMEIPTVVTSYPGPSSAMLDGETGIAINVGDQEALYNALKELLSNKEKAQMMGKSGRQFVEACFERKQFIRKYMENRMHLLGVQIPKE